MRSAWYNDRMARKNINSRADGVTKDMQQAEVRKRTHLFHVRGTKVYIEADTHAEALVLLKKQLNK